MSKIKRGTQPLVLEELQGLEDGSTFWRYSGVVSDSPEFTDDLETNVVWTAEPDDESDDLVVSVSPGLMAALVLRARTHCVSCTGCTRA